MCLVVHGTNTVHVYHSCKKVNFETLKNKCQIEPIHCILYQYKVNHTHLNNLRITSSSSTILLNGCIRVSYSLHWYMHPDQFLFNVFHACFFMRHRCVQLWNFHYMYLCMYRYLNLSINVVLQLILPVKTRTACLNFIIK